MKAKDIEANLNHLTNKKGITIVEIREKLGLDHGAFYSWRRSTKKARREELAEQIFNAFKADFEDLENEDNQEENTNSSQTERKYIKLLEKNIAEIREDRDKMREENERLMTEVVEEMKNIKAQLNRLSKE